MDTPAPQFILASASSRRRELLDQAGLIYQVKPAHIDESVVPDESPGDYVVRIATLKANKARSGDTSQLPVLAADTAVVLEDRIFGKPADVEHAIDMLGSLSGRTHQVMTAVVLLARDGEEFKALNTSRVTFAKLDPGWIEAYCASGEPLDKAGGYAIQGLAAEVISRLEGSYSGVMGLPLFETLRMLRKAGIQTPVALT